MFSELVNSIAERGVGVMDHFLSEAEVLPLRKELREFRAAGAMQAAGLGRKRQERADIRNDLIKWFEEDSLSPAQAILWTRLEALRIELNREFYLGLLDCEGHFAVYEPGGIYQRHLDRFADSGRRTVSVVCYLNDHWLPEDGGQLKVYARDPTAVDELVSPLGGRLVAFLSAEIEHEVCPAPRRERLSFAGWFRRRP